LGYEVPFSSVPSVIKEGFRAEQHRVIRRDLKLAAHYELAENCLVEHRESWQCELLLMIVLTVLSSSVIPSVAAESRVIKAGPRQTDTRQFAANLVTHMLWYLYPKDFPSENTWERDWEERWGSISCVSEMTRELRKQGVNNWLLQALGWVDVKEGSKQARNGDTTLRPELQLLELRRALRSLRKRNAGYFIARVYGSRDPWFERCSSIIKEKTEIMRSAK
jgi:hypothetical protein